MQEFQASAWLDAIEYLTRYAEKLGTGEAKPLPDEAKATAKKNFKTMSESCRDIGLDTAAELAAEMLKESQKATYTSKKYGEDFGFLRRALVANMRSMKCMRISPEYVKFHDALETVDETIFAAFPGAIEDIESAGKCLAYEQGTACVFHLMRVMELGLKVFAKELGIPYAPSWESYLTQVETKISEKNKSKTTDWKRDEPYFREVAGDLQIVKIVWRNPTMHIVRSYSQTEGREIFNAVVAFMKRLSEKFSEAEQEDAEPKSPS